MSLSHTIAILETLINFSRHPPCNCWKIAFKASFLLCIIFSFGGGGIEASSTTVSLSVPNLESIEKEN
jgi:hypothetical protein